MIKKHQILALSTLLGVFLLGTVSPVEAGSDTMIKLLKILHEKGTIDKETYDLLKESALSDGVVAEKQTSDLDQVVKKTKDTVTASLSGGHLKFKSDEGDFKLQLGGRIMVDGAWYDSDQQGLHNGTELRRARIFSKGTFWNDWHFKADYGFGGNTTGIRDAYLAYSGLGKHLPVPLTVKVGHFFEPFGLEILTSSKYITFMERSLSTVFVPGRSLGISLATHGDNWTTAMGAFGKGVDNENSNNHESYGFASRATFAPLYEKNRSVHLGAGFEYRKLKGEDVRVRTPPESHISNVRLVDATVINADDSIKWGVEAATVLGPFSVQAEYIDVSYDVPGSSTIDFNGWYSYASWFVTGESRNYKASQGKFVRVKPKSIVGQGGYGAFEVGVRYSSIDLNDGLIKGGREDNITLGLNWYATPSIRFMANYIFVDSDRNGLSDDPQIFQIRSQIDF